MLGADNPAGNSAEDEDLSLLPEVVEEASDGTKELGRNLEDPEPVPTVLS